MNRGVFMGYNRDETRSLSFFLRDFTRKRLLSVIPLMNSTEPNDPLSASLAQWRVNPTAAPGFRPAVWDRIRRGARATWTAYVRTHLVGWSVVAGLAVVAAGWTGHSLARVTLDARRDVMVVSYLGELDPRVIANLRPSP